jgi:hypothetical protein
MIAFIERVFKRDKNDYIDNRHLLICNNCYWCVSYLPDLENDTIEYFDNCPMCKEKINGMFISEDASKTQDTKHIQNMMTGFNAGIVVL